MQLREFQVQSFRNVIDSTPIKVEQGVTCLVGKNESGKTNLLQALYRLKPAYGERFDLDEQYPRWLLTRDRRSGATQHARPIRAVFCIEDEDRAAVEARVGAGVLCGDSLIVSTSYDGTRHVECPINEVQAVRNILDQAALNDPPRGTLDRCQSLAELRTATAELRQQVAGDPMAAAAQELLPKLDAIEGKTNEALGGSPTLWDTLVALLLLRVPLFFYFGEYNLLPGRLDLQQLVPDASAKPASSAIQTARALLELAGTDIAALGDERYELRKAELEAVSNDLTRQVFEYWTQNKDLSVEIDVDKETVHQPNGTMAVARYLDVRVRDRRHGYTNNFGQRSSGFQWFFSFLAAFSEFEEREGGVVVLLDEPALSLHARAQEDFLRFIDERLAPSAQVLYTTHSPFMVPMGHLERVRIVEDQGPERGAIVSADVLASDRDSIYPLQAAIGYDIAQNLFVGPNNLLVEGTSDFTYLTVLSDHLRAQGMQHLDERWRILPAGGASNIPAFVALIGPHLDVTVVVDAGTEGMQRLNAMAKKGLLQGQRLITVAEVTGTTHADIEDLFAPQDYLDLFNAAMGKAIKMSKLPAGDRIVKRLAKVLGGDFDHGVPAEYLLRNRDTVCASFSHQTLEQFERLAQRINATLAK